MSPLMMLLVLERRCELGAESGLGWVLPAALRGLVCAGAGVLTVPSPRCGTVSPVKGSQAKYPDSNPAPRRPGCVTLGKEPNPSEPGWNGGPRDPSSYLLSSAQHKARLAAKSCEQTPLLALPVRALGRRWHQWVLNELSKGGASGPRSWGARRPLPAPANGAGLGTPGHRVSAGSLHRAVNHRHTRGRVLLGQTRPLLNHHLFRCPRGGALPPPQTGLQDSRAGLATL